MKHILNASQPDLSAPAFALQGPVAFGRFLLMLAAISVLTMPLTQGIWTWDRFLHGGQDFETGMLTIVIILCLAVLLSQLGKGCINLLFTIRCMLAFTFNRGELPAKPLARALLIFCMGAAIDIYRLPLRI